MTIVLKLCLARVRNIFLNVKLRGFALLVGTPQSDITQQLEDLKREDDSIERMKIFKAGERR